jgi:hypothetical protein
MVVDVDGIIVDGHRFTGQADDSLDEILVGLTGLNRMKHDDVESRRIAMTVCARINPHFLTVAYRRVHRLALHDEGTHAGRGVG